MENTTNTESFSEVAQNIKMQIKEAIKKEDTELESKEKLTEDKKLLETIKEKREALHRKPALLAHGGTEYANRKLLGWENAYFGTDRIGSGPLEDVYGLTGSEISFGVGQKSGKHFIILRQAQKVGQRLYAYSLLFDPGEVIWRMAHWNGAQIITKILNDSELQEKFLRKPEEIDLGTLIPLLEQIDWDTTPVSNKQIEELWQEATSKPDKLIVLDKTAMGKSSPERLAESLAAIPESIRKKVTWFMGGGGTTGQAFGSQVVLDTWLSNN